MFSHVTLSSSSLSGTCQALRDLFRPRPIASSKVFHDFCLYLFYNSALFLESCCCSFSLHVVANLNLSSYFSPIGPTFNSTKISSYFLWPKRLYLFVVLKNFMSIEVILFIFFLRFEISLPHKRTGRANELYAFSFENIWSKVV